MISPCLFVDLQGKHSAFSLLRVGFETQVNVLKSCYWVLIVESDGMLADAYERIIERAGGRPLGVGSSQEAMLVLQNKRIDAVLLELQPPVMDGMRLLERMHEELDRNLVKIVLSHHDDPDDIMKAYELGADRYILKAWSSPSDLVNVLNETLANSMRAPRRLWQQT